MFAPRRQKRQRRVSISETGEEAPSSTSASTASASVPVSSSMTAHQRQQLRELGKRGCKRSPSSEERNAVELLRLAAQHDTYYHTMPAEGSPLVPVLFQADQYQSALEVLASFIRTMGAESVEGRRRERRKPRTAADHRNAPSVPWWKQLAPRFFRVRSARPTLMPIILSGVIRQQTSGTEGIEEKLTATAVVFLRTVWDEMAQRQRRIWTRVAISLLGLLTIAIAILWCTWTNVRQSLVQLGYTGTMDDSMFSTNNNGLLIPCTSMTTTKNTNARETTTKQQNKGNGRPELALWTEGYEGACRVAETHVWEQFRDVGMELNSSSHIWDRIVKIPGRSNDEQLGHAPFAMHTIATKSTYNPFSAWMTTTTTTPRRRTSDPSSMTNNNKNKTCPSGQEENNDSLDISWLGHSMVNQLVSDTVRTVYESGNSGIISSKSKGGQMAPFQILDLGCGVGGTLYALASIFHDLTVMTCSGSHSSSSRPTGSSTQHASFAPVKYRGISLGSAEILQARGLAKWHGMNLNRVTFDQGSFDSASPVVGTSSNNNVVIAIESLAFSHNLTATLSNIYNALKPGGVLIVVEDVVVHPSPQVKSYSKTTDRPSLLSHSTWIQTLSSIGFSIDQVQDIGLQYELPQLFLSPSERKMLNQTSWWWWFVGGRGEESVGEPVMLVERLLQWCQDWIKGPVLLLKELYYPPNSADGPAHARFADLRMMQLFQDYFRLLRAHNLRRMAHSNGDLSYFLFVLSKSK
eukprot:CAMPEP_0198291182 /NCGR_PEP_ID=MMETSP1449-20131203/8797_1 /TAXON_ID=420275 /ORGANISM="Attheya septentrionalis, Strain CCMP2084" /LENGTH=747 /DNA_ID=CAMNT_0043989787 /DNA_START=100 /DNA_END=2343 /DNA_ORIENTATION=-